MSDSPLVIFLIFGASLYIFKIWMDDYKARVAGDPNPKGFPGTFPASAKAIIVGVAGALILVGVETAGEYKLGTSEEQSSITILFLLAMIAAGFFEELIFRGYVVVENKGKTALICSIVIFSLLFSLLHFQYYTDKPDDAAWNEITLSFSTQSAWTLLILFVNSLWFYFMRFSQSLNPQRSLIPCFAAHIASNLGVFAVKAIQGHVSGLF